jgi:hypothetical protein
MNASQSSHGTPLASADGMGASTNSANLVIEHFDEFAVGNYSAPLCSGADYVFAG